MRSGVKIGRGNEKYKCLCHWKHAQLHQRSSKIFEHVYCLKSRSNVQQLGIHCWAFSSLLCASAITDGCSICQNCPLVPFRSTLPRILFLTMKSLSVYHFSHNSNKKFFSPDLLCTPPVICVMFSLTNHFQPAPHSHVKAANLLTFFFQMVHVIESHNTRLHYRCNTYNQIFMQRSFQVFTQRRFLCWPIIMMLNVVINE